MAQQPSNNSTNSPHLSHLQNGSAPDSPAMSSVQQGPGSAAARGGPGYQSPSLYPSPSMNTSAQYNYPAPNQVNEPYRASPSGSNGSVPLPSMRTLDPGHQQAHNMGSHLPPVGQMNQPYYPTLPHPNQQSQYPSVTSDPNGAMRYALPQQDMRNLSGGRHKKEIKRRTKTGCLTCRKRRIKCDEGQPTCRNCQKSKRECQGYDPVFKHAPVQAAIQPAPVSSAGGIQLPVAHSYGAPSHLLQGGYGTGNMAYDPQLGQAAQQYQHAAPAIDPALEGGDATSVASGVPYQPKPGKRSVRDLLAMGGPEPEVTPIDLVATPNTLEEVKHLYYSIYAPGLESFLESKWFSVKGLAKLLEDKALLDQFANLLVQFTKTQPNDLRAIAYTASVEARVVWALAYMVQAAVADLNGAREQKTVPPSDDPTEAANRLTVFHTLLIGKVAANNPLTSPIPGSTDHHRLRELEFWYTLANFVMLQDNGPESHKKIDDTLSQLRNLLDGRENRDVLYSIAVVRALGPRVSEYNENDAPLHLDESDNKSKLLVAKKFVSDEANGNGTTNVIRRLCDLATRSWTIQVTPAAPPAPSPAPGLVPPTTAPAPASERQTSDATAASETPK